MPQFKLIQNFSRLSDAHLETKAQGIITAMTGNANFPTPIPALSELVDAHNAFETASNEAESGDKNKIAVKNDKKQALADVLKRLSKYVEMVANEDRTILLSSGFELAKEGSAVGDLPKPENLKVTDGINIGELELSVMAIKGAKTYLFQYTLDPLSPESVWEAMPSTKSKALIKGLKSGQKYWCRVAGVGSTGTLNFSDAVSRISQ